MLRNRINRAYALGRLATCLLLLLLVFAVSAQANTYVSLKGKFYIEYPDTWGQVDYLTTDYFLSMSGAEMEDFDYDAVLALNVVGAFHDNAYLLLSVEPTGKLRRRQVDSVLNEMKEIFGEDVVYSPLDLGTTDIHSSAPVYDRSKGLITVLNDITEGQTVVKKSLYAMKFYEHGMAHFYFYCADSLYEEYQPVFESMLKSFSTEDFRSKLPREELTLVDPDNQPDEPVEAEEKIVVIDLGFSAYIPKSYIPSDSQRMNAYRKIATAETGRDLKRLQAELADMFGPAGAQVQDLLDMAELKIMAQGWKIKSILSSEPDLIFSFESTKESSFAGSLFAKAPGTVRIPDAKTVHIRLGGNYFQRQTLMSVLRKMLRQKPPDNI